MKPTPAQTGSPVEHRNAPITHAMPVLHPASGSQAAQPPSRWHTKPEPHAVPAVSVPVTRQVESPVAQVIDPTRHGDGLQPEPASQALHPPSLAQTWPWPHELPGAITPLTPQPPSGQSIAPKRHGIEGTHVLPGVHVDAQRPSTQPAPGAHVTPMQSGSTHEPLMQAWP
jgi:hypothetical protein